MPLSANSPTEPRGNIGHSADGGIVEAPLKADGAEGGKAVHYADAKASRPPIFLVCACRATQRPDPFG